MLLKLTPSGQYTRVVTRGECSDSDSWSGATKIAYYAGAIYISEMGFKKKLSSENNQSKIRGWLRLLPPIKGNLVLQNTMVLNRFLLIQRTWVVRFKVCPQNLLLKFYFRGKTPVKKTVKKGQTALKKYNKCKTFLSGYTDSLPPPNIFCPGYCPPSKRLSSQLILFFRKFILMSSLPFSCRCSY